MLYGSQKKTPKTPKKQTNKQKKQRKNRNYGFGVVIVELLTFHPYTLSGPFRVELEQVRNYYDCFQKMLPQFFPAGSNWKDGTLNKSLFTLDFWQIGMQFHIRVHFLHI